MSFTHVTIKTDTFASALWEDSSVASTGRAGQLCLFGLQNIWKVLLCECLLRRTGTFPRTTILSYTLQDLFTYVTSKSLWALVCTCSKNLYSRQNTNTRSGGNAWHFKCTGEESQPPTLKQDSLLVLFLISSAFHRVPLLPTSLLSILCNLHVNRTQYPFLRIDY